MHSRVAIVYNEPQPSRYDRSHEEKAVIGVLDSVAAVHSSLQELGYEVVLLPLTPPVEHIRNSLATMDVSLVFNLFEGFCGEPKTEALVPEIMMELGLPFTGCRAKALRLALDKAKVKAILKDIGIPTPDFQLLDPHTLSNFHLGYPCIVKPRNEDASHGITAGSVVKDFASLERQVKVVSDVYGGGALVEEFIDGREFNATALGDARGTVLPVSEIVYSLPPEAPRILTFAAKWETESDYFRGTRVVCPAEIMAEEERNIVKVVLATFRLLDYTGYARVDMRLDGKGELNVIELNPNPDISPGTGAARQAAASGMSYTQFIEKIMEIALEKDKYGSQNTAHVSSGQASADANTTSYSRI